MEKLEQARWNISPDVLCQIVQGQSVLLDVKSEAYYGLNETATSFWKALEETADFDASLQRLLDEYEVPPKILKEDLMDLLLQWCEVGLLSRD